MIQDNNFSASLGETFTDVIQNAKQIIFLS